MSLPSPCQRNCCLDQADICIGCGRSLTEITGWSESNDEQQYQILAAAKQRSQERQDDYASYAAKYGL